MSIFNEIPPTAGLPLSIKEILPIFYNKASGRLEDDFRKFLEVDYAYITYSGTAAFYIILTALKEISPKKTVIIPSFICPLVPLAIERAGLNTLVCDISEDGFDFEIKALKDTCLKNNDILAILPTHLAGIALNLDPLANIAKEKNIFIIEDCAQSLGAMYKGKKLGTIGDFGFYSLCRGKGITIYEGGVITAKPEYSKLINETAKKIERNSYLSESLKLLEIFLYWIFYRPQLFWFAFRMPQIFWEMQNKPEKAFIEYFTSDFPVHNISKRRKAVGHMQWRRLEKEISSQREKAQYYIDNLGKINGLKVIFEPAGTFSNFPYLTLLFDKEEVAGKTFNLFKDSGLGISRIYLYAITYYKYLKNIYSPGSFPNAQYIAKRHLTLTTSTFLKKSQQDYIISKIKGL